MQGGCVARGGDLLFDPVPVFLPHIAPRRAVVDRAQICGSDLHGFHAQIAQGHGIARGAVRLAQLQAQRQRAVAGVRRDDVLDLVCAARGQTAAVKPAIGSFRVPVKEDLIVGLIAGRGELVFDPIGRPGLQRLACRGEKLRLPYAAPGLGRLGDRHGGA